MKRTVLGLQSLKAVCVYSVSVSQARKHCKAKRFRAAEPDCAVFYSFWCIGG